MSNLYICEYYETPYEEGYKVITTLEEHDKQVRAEAIEEFIEWFLNDCYLMLCEETKKEVASSFMRLKEQNDD